MTLLLSGCFGPKTPQAVAKAFWQAVIEHDAVAAAKYSTLTNAQAFTGFDLDWHGYKPEWGKVIIDGDRASIETRFSGLAGNAADKRQCVTYLVRQDGVWKVDYRRTGEDLHGGALGQLFGQLNQMGTALSKSLDASAKQLNAEMQRLGKKLQAMADSFSQQAESILNKHARELQDIMQQLRDSINRALRDKNNHPSEHERQVMVKVAADLNDSSALLAHPDTKSLTACNNDMGMAQQQLGDINTGVSDDYKDQWQALMQRFDRVMRQMLNELADSMNSENNP
ncbi:MAG: hypothetical protein P8Z75_11865 [Gammaproteobacteria bacterium]